MGEIVGYRHVDLCDKIGSIDLDVLRSQISWCGVEEENINQKRVISALRAEVEKLRNELAKDVDRLGKVVDEVLGENLMILPETAIVMRARIISGFFSQK